MGGFVPGPVIKFQFSEDDLVAQVKSILATVNQQVQSQNKQISQSITGGIANPLIAQAAQLRALYSTGSIALKDLQVQQRALISSLDTQIKQLAARNDLDRQALTTLKQLTLERERQQNALNRGVGVGVTAGTSSALSGLSGPILSNISRLGTGLLGVAGGSGGGGGAAFSAAASGIAGIAAAGGPAGLVIGVLTAELLGATAAAVGLSTAGGDLAQRLSNISQRTGISIQNLQVLEAVAKTSNLGLEDIVIGFRKFSQALSGGDGIDSGDGTGGVAGATKKASEILKVLGVTSKDSFTAIEQVASAFQNLPDGPEKSAAAIQLFGRSGLQLIPILNQGADGVERFRAIVAQFAPTVDRDAVQAQLNWQLATEKLSLAFDTLKVDAIPVLAILTQLATSSANFLNIVEKSPSGLAKGFLAGIGRGLTEGNGNPFKTSAAIFGDISSNLASVSAQAKNSTGSFDGLAAAFALAVSNANPLLKALEAIFNGDADAAKKRFDEFNKKINENAAEFQKQQIERGNAAQALINGINDRLPPGASESDRAVKEMNDQITKLKTDIFGLPGLAEAAAAAIAKLTRDTIAGLAQIESDSLEKASESVEKTLEEQATKRLAINNIIKQAQDQAAVDAAAATGNAVAKIIAEEQKRFDELKKNLILQGASEQDLANLRVAIEQDANDKIAKARKDEIDKTNKQIEQQAGQLFDALVRGGGGFTTALKNSLENIALAPVKQVFDAVIAGILTKPVQAAKDALKNLGDSLKGQGGILGDIGKALSPSDAIGNNTGSVNLNTTSTNRNTAALNSLTGALTGNPSASTSGGASSSSGGSLSGLGQILFGGAGGAGGVIFHGLPTGGSSSGSGSILFGLPTGGGLGGVSLSTLSPGAALSKLFPPAFGLLAGGTNLIAGITGHNVAQATGGGITIAGAGLSQIGNKLQSPGLQQAGGILGGAGLVISGVAQGGIGGTLSATLGGAEIGTAIAPGIGTAIGAAAGLVAGVIGALFGHHGFTPAQIAAAVKRQTVDPNKFVGIEFDRSAQGSFGDTLNTIFSEGPGGTFSNSAIKGPRQGSASNVTFNVSAVDAKGVADFFNQHGGTMAKIVAGQVNSTQSGLARQIRAAVGPA